MPTPEITWITQYKAEVCKNHAGHRFRYQLCEYVCFVSKEFLCPALAESSIYRRVAGYFSSSLWILIQTELVDFVDRGGKMFLVCSPAMSHRDLDAIAEGQHDPSALQKYAGKNIQSFVENPDNNGSGALLCYLMASGILEIRFAFLNIIF